MANPMTEAKRTNDLLLAVLAELVQERVGKEPTTLDLNELVKHRAETHEAPAKPSALTAKAADSPAKGTSKKYG